MHPSRARAARKPAPVVGIVLIAFWLLSLSCPRSAAADSRPRYVHWKTPERASAVPAPLAPIGDGDAGTSSDAGDGGFVNNGYIPWQGGPVITQLKVAAVFWGSAVDPNVVSDIQGFYQTLTTGSFMHYASEYATPNQTPGAYGTVVGAFTIQPTNTATVLTDSDIITELSQQIASAALPPNDANTVFMVHLPPGVSIDDPQVGKSCVAGGFCAYHKSGSGIIYSVLPDFSQGPCAPGPPNCTGCCGDKSPFDSLTAVASHELLEAVTDPMPTENAAWINPVVGGEIGDLCSYAKNGPAMYTSVYSRAGRQYTAQKGWSNHAYLQHFGVPNVGCVDYPTTLCCNDAQSNCLWLPNGTTTCPNPTGNSPSASTVPNGIVVTAPTLGGFGNATAAVTRRFVDRQPFPLGISDLLSAPALSPTILITSDTALVGASTACFAHVTDATEREIVQCVPQSPTFPCAELNGTTQQTASGPQCCVVLASVPSVDGTQICARFPVLGATVIELPGLPRWAVAMTSIVLVGLGTLAARRRVIRSWAWDDKS
jgi:hypothetical protein